MTNSPHNETEPLVLAGQGRNEEDLEFEGMITGIIMFLVMIGAVLFASYGWSLLTKILSRVL